MEKIVEINKYTGKLDRRLELSEFEIMYDILKLLENDMPDFEREETLKVARKQLTNCFSGNNALPKLMHLISEEEPIYVDDKYNIYETLKLIAENNTPLIKAIYVLSHYPSRYQMITAGLKKDAIRRYGIMTPLFLSAYKEHRNIMYGDWTKSTAKNNELAYGHYLYHNLLTTNSGTKDSKGFMLDNGRYKELEARRPEFIKLHNEYWKPNYTPKLKLFCDNNEEDTGEDAATYGIVKTSTTKTHDEYNLLETMLFMKVGEAENTQKTEYTITNLQDYDDTGKCMPIPDLHHYMKNITKKQTTLDKTNERKAKAKEMWR